MYAKLINNLETLKMEKTVTYIKDYLDVVAKKEIGLMEALIHLTDIEIEHRTAIASKTQITVANFPYVKDLVIMILHFSHQLIKVSCMI